MSPPMHAVRDLERLAALSRAADARRREIEGRELPAVDPATRTAKSTSSSTSGPAPARASSREGWEPPRRAVGNGTTETVRRDAGRSHPVRRRDATGPSDPGAGRERGGCGGPISFERGGPDGCPDPAVPVAGTPGVPPATRGRVPAARGAVHVAGPAPFAAVLRRSAEPVAARAPAPPPEMREGQGGMGGADAIGDPARSPVLRAGRGSRIRRRPSGGTRRGVALAGRRPNVRPDFPPLHPCHARHVFGLDVFGSGLA